MSEYLCGFHAALEALRGRYRLAHALYLDQRLVPERLRDLVALAEQQKLEIHRVSRNELEERAGHSRHQGVLLHVAAFTYAPMEHLEQRWRASGQAAFFLLLDGITDPHNLGAILRSADAAGCHGVIVPKDRSCPVTAVVDRISAGALAHVPICRVTNLARAVEDLKKIGVWVYGLAAGEESSSLYSTDMAGNIALVVGSEGSGLRPNIRRHCDGVLEIPMAGGVSSLNASVAAGVALFEVVRQRLGQGAAATKR